MFDQDDDTEQLALPHHPEAEAGLLGAVLLKPALLDEVVGYLQPEHFFYQIHNVLFMHMLDLHRERKSVDLNTLHAMMDGSALYEDVEGKKFLTSLLRGVVSALPSQARSYADIIIDASMRRDMLEHAAELMVSCRKPLGDGTAKEILQTHESRLMKLATIGDTGGLVKMRGVMDATLAEWERQSKGMQGISSGFDEVDRMLGGMHPGDVYVLAGATAMGKSAFAVNIAFNAADYFASTDDLLFRGKQVVFFSLEMQKEQIGGRIITGKTKLVSPRNSWKKEMSGDDWQRAIEAASRYGDMPFWVDDAGEQRLSTIRSRLIRLHRRKPVGLIVLDYVQLIMADRGMGKDRLQELSAITRAIKRLAKEIGCPILELAQLSRSLEQREDKRPMLSDLRESGTIEQDADAVLFIYRPEYYLERETPQRKGNERQETYLERVTTHGNLLDAARGKADIIVAKNRHGGTGTVRIQFDKKATWFADDVPDGPPPHEEEPGFGF